MASRATPSPATHRLPHSGTTMLTVHSPDHALHHGAAEFYRGRLVPCFEMPSRVEHVLASIAAAELGAVIPPESFGREPLVRVHAPDYVAFLESAWAEWSALGETGDALPYVWPARDLRGDVPPAHIDGKLGFYSIDAAVPITAGTWTAVSASANVALTGAKLIVDGARSAFALCRPPGHHAGARAMGGFCYLNNAAIAAQYWRDHGMARVAILDVDYHHGNGTQAIFYDRADVLFASLHGDPQVEYPFFLGYADETGTGAGEGFNLNLPLAWGTEPAEYLSALDTALERIAGFGADGVVVSLGVDTFEHDPISHFKLTSADYPTIGARIAALGLPTLFVMEGGYAVADIGTNVVNVLRGFEGG
ncbi:histone deacetylase family protein [Novosphingobium sp.]|uniref:histone deacetylase family protein n=1 Tax=Novosphingobium sp. TaxID=1874826 RepID=UPI0038BDDAE0